jgi:5-methylcytosine-specific restriction endonuclease McrA
MNFQEELITLAKRAKEVHAIEHRAGIESVELIAQLEAYNAAVNLGMTSENFARAIGLSPNQYWKRAQAARVIRFFPQCLDMLKSGETAVSNLALISPRITQANADIILSGIKNKTKREVEGLLSRVTLDGKILDQEAEVELRVRLSESQLKTLDRAREVLSHGGHVPTLCEIFMKSLGDLLEKRDPLRKAERAAARKERSESKDQTCDTLLGPKLKDTNPSPEKTWSPDEVGVEAASPEKEGVIDGEGVGSEIGTATSHRKEAGTTRPAIPAAIRHAVWLRDQGKCTFEFPNGSRCGDRTMLELDHLKMWCRGGEHSVENLTLRCRHHNQFSAMSLLGVKYMTRKFNGSQMTN